METRLRAGYKRFTKNLYTLHKSKSAIFQLSYSTEDGGVGYDPTKLTELNYVKAVIESDGFCFWRVFR